MVAAQQHQAPLHLPWMNQQRAQQMSEPSRNQDRDDLEFAYGYGQQQTSLAFSSSPSSTTYHAKKSVVFDSTLEDAEVHDTHSLNDIEYEGDHDNKDSLSTDSDTEDEDFSNILSSSVRNGASIPISPTHCTNCNTHTTPLWRRDQDGNPLCNACGLFLKLHGRTRPLSLKTDVIKKRNRGGLNSKTGLQRNVENEREKGKGKEKDGKDKDGERMESAMDVEGGEGSSEGGSGLHTPKQHSIVSQRGSQKSMDSSSAISHADSELPSTATTSATPSIPPHLPD
ncbi:hypothetical protein BGZ98_008464, partial [Dissophora globulifera]